MRKIEIEVPTGYKEVIKQTCDTIQIKIINEDLEREIMNYFNPFLTNLLLITDERFPNSVFYIQNKKIIFELQKKEDELYFWVDYCNIWKGLYNRFNLNDVEIQEFIKTIVEYKFKLTNITPLFSDPTGLCSWKIITYSQLN